VVQFLEGRNELFRVFPIPDFGLLRNPGFNLHGVNLATGRHDFTIRRYDRLLREFDLVSGWLGAKYYRGQNSPHADEELLESVGPLLDLVNVRYIAAPRGIELHSERFPAAFSGEKYSLYENPSALPWFYLVPRIEVMDDEEKIVERLRNGEVDLRETAILEDEPPLIFEAGEVGNPEMDRVERLDYDLPAGYIQLKASCGGPRLLVVSENYHSNWRVYVDGEEAEMLRANFVWKGVCLPAGEHRVEFRYRSPVLLYSRTVSGVSLLAILGIFAGDFFSRRRMGLAAATEVA
jgi:hypothetical protein